VRDPRLHRTRAEYLPIGIDTPIVGISSTAAPSSKGMTMAARSARSAACRPSVFCTPMPIVG